MDQFDFDENEYIPVQTAFHRAELRRQLKIKKEWQVNKWGEKHKPEIVLVSHTFDSDVVLSISGNFSLVEKERIAKELCDQLNLAEELLGKSK